MTDPKFSKLSKYLPNALFCLSTKEIESLPQTLIPISLNSPRAGARTVEPNH